MSDMGVAVLSAAVAGVVLAIRVLQLDRAVADLRQAVKKLTEEQAALKRSWGLRPVTPSSETKWVVPVMTSCSRYEMPRGDKT